MPRGCIPDKNKPQTGTASSNTRTGTSSTVASHVSSSVAEKVRKHQTQKIGTWKELTRNVNCEMEMMTVMDLGPRKTTRMRRTTWKLDTRKTPDKENKPEVEVEAATPRTPSNKMSRSNKLEKLKMATPNKVKTAFPSQSKSGRQESPRNQNLKRLNQQNLKPAKPGTSLYHQKADDSKRNFISLISKWENFSNTALTSVVQTMPRSNHKTDGQSREVLENNFENIGQAPE